jgi:hypothetical protein
MHGDSPERGRARARRSAPVPAGYDPSGRLAPVNRLHFARSYVSQACICQLSVLQLVYVHLLLFLLVCSA